MESTFCHLYINSYYLQEVIHYYKAEKRRKNHVYIIDAHRGIDSGPLVKESNALTTRLGVRYLTVYIGHTIRVPAIFLLHSRYKLDNFV